MSSFPSVIRLHNTKLHLPCSQLQRPVNLVALWMSCLGCSVRNTSVSTLSCRDCFRPSQHRHHYTAPYLGEAQGYLICRPSLPSKSPNKLGFHQHPSPPGLSFLKVSSSGTQLHKISIPLIFCCFPPHTALGTFINSPFCNLLIM